MSEDQGSLPPIALHDPWRDISTAPKDGTWIVLTGPAWGGSKPDDPVYVTIGGWYDGAWREFREMDVAMYSPTAWTVLPTPQQASKGGGELKSDILKGAEG